MGQLKMGQLKMGQLKMGYFGIGYVEKDDYEESYPYVDSHRGTLLFFLIKFACFFLRAFSRQALQVNVWFDSLR